MEICREIETYLQKITLLVEVEKNPELSIDTRVKPFFHGVLNFVGVHVAVR